jgi:integrase
MTAIRLRGFKIFKDRHGKWRAYHRKTGAALDLKKFPMGSVEFLAECQRITSLINSAAPKEKPGTLGLLITEYRSSQTFLDLAPRTQRDYQSHFDYLRAIADVPLMKFDRPLVVRIRDKAAETKGRRFGNYLKASLSVIFGWGSERGYLAGNPASGIKSIRRKKGAPDANRPWSDAERHAVLEAAPAHMLSAFGLMMFTALGPKDTLTLPRNFWRNGEIATKRSKTGEPVFWPVPAPLDEILKAAPAHDAVTLCANSYGRPWTYFGFNSSWQRLRKQLENDGRVQSGLTLYGLRHTVATILAEIGFNDRAIADALGQATEAMARHYSRRADRKRNMKDVVASFEAELNRRRTKTVKPD